MSKEEVDKYTHRKMMFYEDGSRVDYGQCSNTEYTPSQHYLDQIENYYNRRGKMFDSMAEEAINCFKAHLASKKVPNISPSIEDKIVILGDRITRIEEVLKQYVLKNKGNNYGE